MHIAWVVAAIEAAVILAIAFAWWRARGAARTARRQLADQVAKRANPRRRRRNRLVPAPDVAVKAVWETATLVRDKGVTGALRHRMNEIAGWAEVQRPELVQMAGDDGCVAIMFSDIEGSTTINDEVGDRAWNSLLMQHDRVVERQIAAFDGHIVKHQGDGYMVAFATAPAAVRAAIAIEKDLEKRRSVRKIRVRIGLHYGSVVHRDNDIFGRNVAHAARVADLAGGSQVLVSGAVAEAVADHNDVADRMVDQGTVELKGLTGPHQIWAVDWRDQQR